MGNKEGFLEKMPELSLKKMGVYRKSKVREGLEREVGAHAKRICPQFSVGNPLAGHELGMGFWTCLRKPG